jgi:hypothetical protein
MEIAIAILVSASLLVAVFLALSRIGGGVRRPRLEKRESGSSGARSCPLCSSVLGPGERVKSSLSPGKADRIMHIFGCAHCWPATVSVSRICPVCKGALGVEGWVIARYFERPGRKHVHVLGCTGCRVR